MPDQITYSDITEQNEVSYSLHGYTATRVFIIDGVDMSDPASTTANALDIDDIPQRGDDHPSGQDMQADEIKATALSSTQIKITVTYRKLSAADQEPDDSKPALMTIGSTVQEQETPFDADGNLMNADYATENGATPNYTITSTTTGDTVSDPSIAVTAKVQIPNTIIRFQRREQSDPSDKIKAYVGAINSSACQWGSLSADVGTLLCTRIEGSTPDNGTSYVVEYEFQYTAQTWQYFTAYSLPNNCSGTANDGSNATIGPGDSPSDAALEEFDVYPSAEFNNLSLV